MYSHAQLPKPNTLVPAMHAFQPWKTLSKRCLKRNSGPTTIAPHRPQMALCRLRKQVMGPRSPSQQHNPLAQSFVPHASSSHPSPHCITHSSISDYIGPIPLAPPFLPDSGRQTTKTPNQPAQLPSSFSVLSLNRRSIVNK